jgi:hypothetical protein
MAHDEAQDLIVVQTETRLEVGHSISSLTSYRFSTSSIRCPSGSCTNATKLPVGVR